MFDTKLHPQLPPPPPKKKKKKRKPLSMRRPWVYPQLVEGALHICALPEVGNHWYRAWCALSSLRSAKCEPTRIRQHLPEFSNSERVARNSLGGRADMSVRPVLLRRSTQAAYDSGNCKHSVIGRFSLQVQKQFSSSTQYSLQGGAPLVY